MGSPVGSESYTHDIVKKKIEDMEKILQKLVWLEDSHIDFVLLRSCFSLPKMSYLMRTLTVPPHAIMDSYKRFDNAVQQTLATIISSLLSETLWTQTSLSMAGMGLRRAELHTTGSYLVSVLAACSYVQDLRGTEIRMETAHFLAAMLLLNKFVNKDQFIKETSQKVVSHSQPELKAHISL